VVVLYFNFFVLIVQSFEKVPALHALAPHQTETPFKVAQLCALLLFVALGIFSARRFRGERLRAISRAA
jgi:flagellar biogenesis protein FliO